MQQYFADSPLTVGEEYELNAQQAHHAGTVMKMDGEKVRLVYNEKGYFAIIHRDGKAMRATVIEEDKSEKELAMKTTLALALIRREKLELVLQKACELGCDRIVLFESSRCVVHEKKDRIERQMERWRTILTESCAQCKRNHIPELIGIVSLKELKDYRGDCNFVAYENADRKSGYLSQLLKGDSCTVAIGPEGGFSEAEVAMLEDFGFDRVTLGTRILRAETAAMYTMAVIGEWSEGQQI